MQSFLENVVFQHWQTHKSFTDFVFILPSKRAGAFLRNAIAKVSNTTLFAPDIYSIETFVEKISGLTYASNTVQLFTLYESYLKVFANESNDFYTFSKWANTLLQDFNEIDRYLVDPEQLFQNLSAIQEISIWEPDAERTELMDAYLLFWNNIKPLYTSFNNALLAQNSGHQGLVYRTAVDSLPEYISATKETKHVFIGFNALNTAESTLIQHLLKDEKNQIYWDIDSSFIDDPIHDAGFFIRQHSKNWPHIVKNGLNGVSSFYGQPKNIQIIGVPKNISQAKHTANILTSFSENQLKNTAVVLGDETLLNPILNSIPLSISNINITMGYPLVKSGIANLFFKLFELYIDKNEQGWYYRNVLDFLTQPSISMLLTDETTNYSQVIAQSIFKENTAYIKTLKHYGIPSKQQEILEALLTNVQPTPKTFIQLFRYLIHQLKPKYEALNDDLHQEYLYKFHQLFNQIEELIHKYPYITDIKSLHSLFTELLSKETLDFKGEPLDGLQIMGMLESRNLDFENIILTSVNEGVLPAGKANNSFLPLDLKRKYGLPTFKEKDAVYTYHFYRLMQRAKNVYIIYNTEPDALNGGEKSRLLLQLLTDKNKKQDITEKIITPKVTPISQQQISIAKDENLVHLIKKHCASGFSPTSLTNFIKNPITFYKRNLLGINDLLEVEENLAANTIGTIIHETLEDIYTPFIGQVLKPDALLATKTKVESIVEANFKKSYPGGNYKSGKNLIAYHVIIRYIQNFINIEIADAEQNTIKLIALEQRLKTTLDFPEVDFPIVLKGTIDRIDEKNGKIRIIDYKSGLVQNSQVEIPKIAASTADYKHSKAFQLLCYALIYHNEKQLTDLVAGIISIRKLNSGLITFGIKPPKGYKNETITTNMLAEFKLELKKLILEICSPQIPFIDNGE